ncbi:hypothetical protein IscW_ISCW015264, partial [Ixodes scapularis]
EPPQREPPPYRLSEWESGGDNCWFCGRRYHPREVCPALHSQCFRCTKMGHFAVVCRSRQSPPTSFPRDQRP